MAISRIVIDERAGLPSASTIARILECPGSWNAERGLPSQETEIAKIGTRRHKSMETGIIKDDSDTYSVERAGALENEVVNMVFGSDDGELSSFKEDRFWARDPELNPLWSGQVDKYYVIGKKALIIDYKMGYAMHEEAKSNIQLRCYAILLKENFPDLEEIYVAIIQPNLPKELQLSVAFYTSDELSASASQIRNALMKASLQDAPRMPSLSACKYCKAASTCKESNSFALQLESIQAIETASPEQICELLDRAKIFNDRIVSAAKKRGIQLIESGNILGSYRIGRRATTSLNATMLDVLSIFSDTITQDDILSACTPGLAQVIDIYASKSGLPKTKAKKEVEIRLSDKIVKTEGEPFLTR